MGYEILNIYHRQYSEMRTIDFWNTAEYNEIVQDLGKSLVSASRHTSFVRIINYPCIPSALNYRYPSLSISPDKISTTGNAPPQNNEWKSEKKSDRSLKRRVKHRSTRLCSTCFYRDTDNEVSPQIYRRILLSCQAQHRPRPTLPAPTEYYVPYRWLRLKRPQPEPLGRKPRLRSFDSETSLERGRACKNRPNSVSKALTRSARKSAWNFLMGWSKREKRIDY
jgi:hypothetical protein